jgi:regulator of protease activity HflC (stomatin/prohibitin superfamily)
MSDGAFGAGLGTALTFGVILIGGGLMYGCPQYAVYEQRLTGEAELARAEYSRQVQVRDAQGRLDSAGKLADAEVRRAEGVAKANAIIGDSLKGNEAYLKYLWITDVTGAKAPTVIYVPTEANIPILEAGRTPAAR